MTGGAGFFARHFCLFRRHETGIGAAFGHQFGNSRGVATLAAVLEDNGVVGLQAQPVQTLEDSVDRRFGRTFAVSVLDADEEFAAGVSGIKPVEQGCARATDMEIAGR